MRIIEKIVAWGHPNITGKNTKTFEITKEGILTTKGDCIVGVKASKGAADLKQSFKELAKQERSIITVILNVDNWRQTVVGKGSPQLTFTHRKDLVVRKSNYTCPRTLMIQANKTAIDLSRNLIQLLQNPQQKLEIVLIVQG